MIIGVMGQARVGKDTLAECLIRNRGFVRVGLADPMKRFCAEVFAFTDEQLYGDKRDAPDERYIRGFRFDEMGKQVLTEYLTPRFALQTLGTEWGRSCYRDIWLETGIRTAKHLLGGGFTYSAREGLKASYENPVDPIGSMCAPPEGVVFSDLRFRNEFDAMKKAGAVMVRVYRPDVPGIEGISGHASEKEQEGVKDDEFDIVLHNDGSLKEYRELIGDVFGVNEE